MKHSSMGFHELLRKADDVEDKLNGKLEFLLLTAHEMVRLARKAEWQNGNCEVRSILIAFEQAITNAEFGAS